MIEIIVEILLEVLINVFGEILFDIGLSLLRESAWQNRSAYPVLAFLGYAFLGVVAGGLSLVVFPRQFTHAAKYHGIGLLAIPTLAGLAMAALGAIKSKMGKILIRLDTFSYAFVFAFFMTLTRFIYAR